MNFFYFSWQIPSIIEVKIYRMFIHFSKFLNLKWNSVEKKLNSFIAEKKLIERDLKKQIKNHKMLSPYEGLSL